MSPLSETCGCPICTLWRGIGPAISEKIDAQYMALDNTAVEETVPDGEDKQE